jgi:hypothetical protein
VKKRYVIDGSLKRIIRNKEVKVFPVSGKERKDNRKQWDEEPETVILFCFPSFFSPETAAAASAAPQYESLQQRLLSTSHNPVHHRWVGPASR